MYRIGKIYGDRTLRKVFNISLRGKTIYIVCKQIQIAFYKVEELFIICGILLPLKDLSEPIHFGIFGSRSNFTASALFIFPVCSNTEFGSFMHFLRSYLYFERLTVISYQCSMQRLVHIRFGHGYIILKPSRYRLIKLVDHTQCGITVYKGIHYDPYGKKIVYLLKVFVLTDHFFVY